MKIATWNVNSLRVRLAHVLAWLDEHQPDVLALQETKTIDTDFPAAEFIECGYHVNFSGQKTYNGVAIISKQAADDIATDFPGFDDPARRILAATIADWRILNLYVPNGASLDSDKYPYKLNWLAALNNFVKTEQAKHDKLVILGDFNIAPTDLDVHDPKVWADGVLVSPAERAALQDLLDLGFHDCLRAKHPEVEKLFTWWDYRQAAFRRDRGLRIDHILASNSAFKVLSDCQVDKAPRKLERPSDHAPVWALFSQ